jgi:hypothetical protein
VSLMCRPYSLPGAPALFDVSGGRNRGSESAGSTSSDKFEFVFGNRPIFMGRIGRQRSNRKPICHLLSAVELERKPNNHRLNLRSSQAGQRRMEARPLQGGPLSFEEGNSPKRTLAGWRRSADRTCLQPNSLLTGNLRGKFMIFGLPAPLSMQETAVLQRLLVKFPTHINRENISRIREIFDLNREFKACAMNTR